MMNEFKNYHPLVNFLYFISVILFSMLLMNPIMLIISLVCAVTYSVMLGGRKAIKFNLICLLPVMITASAINMAFNHRGVTILAYLPSGNPFTLESMVYGIAASAMIVTVICYFSCFNRIITSDKFIYLFGKAASSLSLILSMSLRFVPRLKEQIVKTTSVQKSMGRFGSGNIVKRAKDGMSVLSVTLTHALESSIETADSMRGRGYGLKNRSAFSVYIFSVRDIIMLLYTAAAAVYIIIGIISGVFEFLYFPKITGINFDAYSLSVFIVYFLLCAEPILIEIAEDIRWKYLKSKI